MKLFSMMNSSLYNDHDFTDELVKSAFDSLLSMEIKLVESSQALVTLHNGLIFCQRSLRSVVSCSDFFVFLFFLTKRFLWFQKLRCPISNANFLAFCVTCQFCLEWHENPFLLNFFFDGHILFF